MNTGEKIDYMIQCLKVAKAEYDSGIVELHISGKLRKTFVFDNMKKDLEIY